MRNYEVFGNVIDAGAIEQLKTCLATGDAMCGALMADHHLGYAAPVGAVIARWNQISPSEVGFDIACGNKAVKLPIKRNDIIADLPNYMDEIVKNISFGVGRPSKSKHISGQVDPSDHDLFYSDTWNSIPFLKDLKDLARSQLGTVGSGNHYIDIFADENDDVWVGVHFGSRGLGHKIASHYIAAGGGVDGINVAPAILSLDTDLGKEYLLALELGGAYAYAGRDWVCNEVARIFGVTPTPMFVHNHHNYSWRETHFGEDVWVTRKGATPARPGQAGFVGATMGEDSVILVGAEGRDSARMLYSTVHGAGRVMSRTEAAGKTKWKKGVKTRVSEGKISKEMMNDWVSQKGVILRGAGTDESPHAYKRLTEVLAEQGDSIQITHTLTPLGVAMADDGTFDPYVD